MRILYHETATFIHLRMSFPRVKASFTNLKSERTEKQGGDSSDNRPACPYAEF